MDYNILTNELELPKYSDAISSGNDKSIADMLNEVSNELVNISTLSRDSFLTAILPATLALASKDAAIQSKWDRLLNIACSASSVSIESWNMLSSLAISDGLISNDYATSVFKRRGSKAEILFGAGTVLSTSDISFALRGNR